jgi:hypothetical protein
MLHINPEVKIRAPLNGYFGELKSVEISVQNAGENEMWRQQLLRKKILRRATFSLVITMASDGVVGWMFDVRGLDVRRLSEGLPPEVRR